MIPKSELPAIASALRVLVNEHGHPDEIPLGSLAARGIDPRTANICELLISDELYSEDPSTAFAKLLRKIGEYAK